MQAAPNSFSWGRAMLGSSKLLFPFRQAAVPGWLKPGCDNGTSQAIDMEPGCSQHLLWSNQFVHGFVGPLCVSDSDGNNLFPVETTQQAV